MTDPRRFATAALAVIAAAFLAPLHQGCRHPQSKNQPIPSVFSATDKTRPPFPFYQTGKPYVRWWWFPLPITEADIDSELDWLEEKGFGGVEIAWIYPYWWSRDEKIRLDPMARWLDEDWIRLVAHAKAYADGRGLGCDFTFGSAWPFGDAKVTDETASRGYPNSLEGGISGFWEVSQRARAIDHLSRQALDQYAQRMLSALRPALAGSRSGLFCDSWEVKPMPYWTAGLDNEFERRFHYDVDDFLIEATTKGSGQIENNDVRYDYLKLVSDYVIENFYRRFTEIASTSNAFTRIQVHGAPVDLLRAYAAANVPETESMLYEPQYGQIAASAAALAGRPIVSSETFTCTYGLPNRPHFREEQTADLKLVADALFANGVNQIVWHGKPFEGLAGKWPTWFYAGTHVARNASIAEELRAFNGYLAKVSSAMRVGRTYSGVAAYLPTEDAWMSPIWPKTTDPKWNYAYPPYAMPYVRFPAELKGWRPLWVNRDFLRSAKVRDGMLRIGDQSFSTLYLDVRYLDSDALDTVLSLARAGVSVCLKKRPLQPGRNKSPDFEGHVRALLALPNVSSDFSNAARGKPLVAGENLPDFWARIEGDQTVIFFANPKAQNLQLPLHYGQSLTDQDVFRLVRITIGGRTTEVSLLFKPYQSILLTLDGSGNYRYEAIAFQPKASVVRTP